MSETHLETAKDEKLSQMQVFLVREQVGVVLGRWAAILGVTNILALGGIYYAVQAQVSSQITTQIATQVSQAMETMRPQIGDEIMNALATAAQVRVTYDQLSKDSSALKEQQASLKIDLQNLGSERASQAARVLTEIGDARNGVEFLKQIDMRLNRLAAWSDAEVTGTVADVGTTGPLPPINESVCEPGSYAVGIKIVPVGVTNSGGNIGRAVRTVQVSCRQLNIAQ